MRWLLDRVTGDGAKTGCHCEPTFDGDRLLVDANGCPGDGKLAMEPDCRATVISQLRRRDVEAVSTCTAGLERAYEDDAAALLVAAGRFADAALFHDEELAERACRDPIGAARDATGRTGPVARIASETGLATLAARATECEHTERANRYESVLTPYVGPKISRARVAVRPPADAVFESRTELDTGAVVRLYEQPATERRTYHVEPVEHTLTRDETATLVAAYDRLASGAVTGGDRAPARAVRRVADDCDSQRVRILERILTKHTHGHGMLADLFADERVSDVFVTAPAEDNRLRIRVDGETMCTNIRLTEQGTEALASRFRRQSGRAFSRANPTLDATATVGNRRVRVAGVTEPVSEGVAFAFRAHERDVWTLPELVANGTLPANAGALLSLAVERDAATLLAGTRGAGKTTLLGALLWELPAKTRTVIIEDTPELPVASLQAADRDVQLLRTTTATGSCDAGGNSNGSGSGGSGSGAIQPTEALRTALRLGEGALVVGEVRGEEAAVLYEAMRVGASGSAVLGTIHGDGGTDVRERVVADLGVPESSFGATDLLVTCEPYQSTDGRARRVKAIEEVIASPDGIRFEPLYELDDGALVGTDRISRGNSRLIETLAGSTESYATLREQLAKRTDWLAELAERGHVPPATLCEAHARRRAEATKRDTTKSTETARAETSAENAGEEREART